MMTTSRHSIRPAAWLLVAVLAAGCGGSGGDALPNGLLISLSQFETTPDGPKPGAARLEFLSLRDGSWQVTALEDPESNVFHKAMVYTPPGGSPGLLTLGGTAALLKLWTLGEGGYQAQTLWQKDFGGKFSRMRDAEVATLVGSSGGDIAVATHDQGVVAVVSPQAGGGFQVKEIDAEPDTFVHEIEIGDLNGDGVLEVYATPSEPNRLDGTPQSGQVVRYVPATGEGRVVVADLGDHHAKEILVEDVDGDGTDELYVSVEDPVEIRRYDAGTDPKKGVVIGKLKDRLCRFLTAGDVDGDGQLEMVAAAFRKGLWLLRPREDPRSLWSMTLIDNVSSGFEHASLLTDLDGDGTDELYVASDDHGEVRRYVWQAGRFVKETIYKRPEGSIFTWNLMPVPVEMIPAN